LEARMNLVEQIKDQISSGVLEQLSTLTGASEGATRSAVGAAVPALLSALSHLSSTSTGAQKLVSALNQFGGGSLDNVAHKLSNQPASVLEQGAGFLSSIFGSSAVSAIVNALSRFTNIAPGVTQKLLGYLMPMVLGSVAGRFAGRALTPQALTSFFADQKSSIANAMPAGLSLSDVPGLSAVSSAVRTAATGFEQTTTDWMRWLLPLCGLAAVALLLWWFFSRTPTPQPGAEAPEVVRAQSPDRPVVPAPDSIKIPVPDVSTFSKTITDTFSSLTETLTGVKDAATAEDALPKLEAISTKLDDAKTTFQKLGDTGKATIKALVKSSQAKLKDLIDKILAIPAVRDKIKPVVDTIMTKLTDLAPSE
jgi:hypothetical protein